VIANRYPGAETHLVDFVNSLIPNLLGKNGEVQLRTFQDNAGRVGIFGFVGFLYAGLGWMSALRNALQTLFAKPQRERPNFFVGTARDLVTLVSVGLMLAVAFVVTTAVNNFSDDIITWLGLDPSSSSLHILLRFLGALLGVALVTGMLMALYQLLARPHVSHRALREGAVLAAVGFVLLQLAANKLMGFTEGQPAFTIFGFALVLLVLMNYFSRVIMYGAAWAYTSKRVPDMYDDEPIGPHGRPGPDEAEPVADQD
jgi:membrane protein